MRNLSFRLLRTVWHTLLPVIVFAISSCAPRAAQLPELQVVSKVDLLRYAGTWYEIAAYPHFFQRGCVASKATYTLLPDGTIEVLNECRKETVEGPPRSVTGRAKVADTMTNAKLKVTFFWPFVGDYWIIDLGQNYEYAVVGHPSREYLWILSRTPQIDQRAYDSILGRLRDMGYDTARLVRTVQPGDAGAP